MRMAKRFVDAQHRRHATVDAGKEIAPAGLVPTGEERRKFAAQGGSLVEPGSSNEALKQAALWPLTLLQQMQEQMQKAATAAVQSRQAQEEPPKT